MSSLVGRRAAIGMATAYIAVFATSGPVQACVGARAVAMGGAYTAVAQGALSAYWNPAALAFSSTSEVAGALPVGGREAYNYDAFGAYSEKYDGKLAGALSVAHSGAVGPVAASLGYSHTSYAYSVATRISEQLSAGATLRYEREVATNPPGVSPARTGKGIGGDLGMSLKVNPQTTFGMLIQDVTSTRLIWSDGAQERYGVNIRPGVAWQPNPATTVALEWYNMGAGVLPWASADASEVRVGGERVFTRRMEPQAGRPASIAVRAGAGHSFPAHETVLSAGIGLVVPVPRVSGALSIDYACKGVWSSAGLTPVHMVGLGFTF